MANGSKEGSDFDGNLFIFKIWMSSFNNPPSNVELNEKDINKMEDNEIILLPYFTFQVVKYEENIKREIITFNNKLSVLTKVITISLVEIPF